NPDSNLKRLNIGNGLGQMLFVIPTFIYYVSYDLNLGFRSGAVPLALGVIVVGLALLANRLQADSPPAKQQMFPVAVAFALLILPLGFLIGWRSPDSGPHTGETIRVMSYNLHQGFNTEGRLDMEAIAQVIEASGADVVALQEVSRGWLTAGSLDMLSWLSHRLDMPYVFGPTADPVWGNAILSRLPFSDTTHPLPTDDLLLRRGYIRAEILTDFGEITIFATHFHHRGDGSEIRQAQAETLLATWNGIPRAIILGDLNSLPATPEMTLFREAGFVDSSQLITGPLLRNTYPSTNPARQIDYIWVTPDFTPLEFEIISSTASDHLPVVVELEIE
ncbi:MAG: endonuclease, partial [Gammaproteobacteria bacterium]|nr:endonuclease [Gammaproteobacteria bacterium]